MVLPVRDEDVTLGVDRDPLQPLELRVALPPPPEGAEEGAVGVEDLDPVVAGVRHEDVTLFVYCHSPTHTTRMEINGNRLYKCE